MRCEHVEVRLTTVLLLVALLIPFMIGDYITTSWLINHGLYNESNPIVASLYRDFGHNGLLLAKVVAFLVIGSAAYLVDMKFHTRLHRFRDGAILSIAGIYVFVVLNNVAVILSLGTANL